MKRSQNVPPTSLARWPRLADDAFQGFAGELVGRLAPHSEADPAALLLHTLACAGNAIGRTAHFTAADEPHYLNLFLAVVGSTGGGRKGASWGRVFKVFQAAAPDWADTCVVSGVDTGKALLEALHGDRPEDVARPDAKPADPPDGRRLLMEPDFAAVLYRASRAGNTLAPLLRAAWDGGPLRTGATPAAGRQGLAAHVSMVGHVTPEELRGALTQRVVSSGLGARFLWAAVRRSKVLPDGTAAAPDLMAQASTRLRAALHFARGVGRLTRDAGAAELWDANYAALTREPAGPLGGMAARLAAQSMRLACVFAVLDRRGEVSREHLLAGLRVAQFSMASADWALGQAGHGDATVERILAELEGEPAGLTRTDIRNVFSHNRSAADIERALGWIAERGLAVMRKERAGIRLAERWVASRFASSTPPASTFPSPSAAASSAVTSAGASPSEGEDVD